MANWIYAIDVKNIWDKYSDLSHEDYDNDPDIFCEMKKELVGSVKNQLKPGHAMQAKEVITKLEKAKHLSSFNTAWNQLYDFLDYNKIWLKTFF